MVRLKLSRKERVTKSYEGSPLKCSLKLKRVKGNNRRDIIDSLLKNSDAFKAASPVHTPENKDKQSKEQGALADFTDGENDISFTEDKELLADIPSSPPMTPVPIRKVAFSSDIEDNSSMILSSPIKSSPNKPMRSILKQTSVPKDNSFSVDELLTSGRDVSWPDGYVLHIPERHPNKSMIVKACIGVLSKPDCDKKYEIFATLNHLIKVSGMNINSAFSPASTNNLIANIDLDLSNLKNDIQKDEISPFRLRISSQGIKLLSSLQKMAANNPMIKKCYDKIFEIMKNDNISKNIVASIIQLWKSKDLVELDDVHMEKLIENIIGMKFFLSGTVICERINLIVKIISSRPAIASKYGYQILSYFLLNIINTDVPSYPKIFSFAANGITIYSKQSNARSILFRILDEPIDGNLSTMSVSMKSQVSDLLIPSSNVCDALIQTLLYATHINMNQQAMNLGYQILYLWTFKESQSSSLALWSQGSKWISVYEKILEEGSIVDLCLFRWNIAVYNFQVNDLVNDDALTIKKKIRFLLIPFKKSNKMNEIQYKLCYYKIFTAIYYQLNKVNHKPMIVRELLIGLFEPIIDAPKGVDFTNILAKMFSLDSSNNHKQLHDPETLLSIQDSIQWKQALKSISKEQYITHFDLVCKIVERGLSQLDFERACRNISNIIHQPLNYLKGDIDNYPQLVQNVHEMIMRLLKVQKEVLKSAGKDEAGLIFKLIQDSDVDLVLPNDQSSLLFKIFNEFSQYENIEFISEFISICLTKYNSDCVFSAIVTSKIFKNLRLIEKLCFNRNNFLPFLPDWINLKKIKSNGNYDLNISDPNEIFVSFKYIFSSYMKGSSNGEDFLKRIGKQIEGIVDYDVLEYFDGSIYVDIFDMMMNKFNEFDKSSKFYSVVTISFFKRVMINSNLITWEKYQDFITSLPNFQYITKKWASFLLLNISENLKPELAFNDKFSIVLESLIGIVDKTERKLFITRCTDLRVSSNIFKKSTTKKNLVLKTPSPMKPNTPTIVLSDLDKSVITPSNIIDPLTMSNKRHTRSATKDTSNFQCETVLNLRKRQRSFEPGTPSSPPPPDFKRQKIMDMVKVSLERTSSDLGDGVEDLVEASELNQFQSMLLSINNKRLDVAKIENKEEIIGQLLTMLMKLNGADD